MAVTFNDRNMTRFMHLDSRFDRILHIAHREWHGIRQCTAYCPGQKLLIPAEAALEPERQPGDHGGHLARAHIGDEIERRGITHVVFQGYSDNAERVLVYLRARFGPELRCFAVNHVTTAQFDNYFEMRMLDRLLARRRMGLLDGIASVKPDFAAVFPDMWDGLILNYAPRLDAPVVATAGDGSDLYVPLAADWRKNMFTNILAGQLAGNVDRVKVANIPYGLDNLVPLDKLRYVGFLRDEALFAEMAASAAVLLATLAECQPMTQLEAMAVGTPSLTGPQRLADFADEELTGLTTTTNLDSPPLLARDIERLIEARRGDPGGMAGMIEAHLARRHALAGQRYGEFLGL